MGSGLAPAAHLTGMTDLMDPKTEPVEHRTTGQLLAIHDAKRRAAATAAGHPTDRTFTAGMHLAGMLGQVAYTGPDSKVYLLDLDADTPAQRMTYRALREAITDAYDLGSTTTKQYRATVIADKETLHRMLQMAERHADGAEATPEARRLSRLLTYRRGLPTSVHTPVLTDALAVRFWLPTGHDPKTLDGWADGFNLSGDPRGRSAIKRLVTLAMDGEVDQETLKSLRDAELWGARSGQYASLSSACTAFAKATTVNDAFAAMLSLDPLLRERNAVDGTVAQIRILQIDAKGITATVSDPFRLREGSKVFLFDGHETLDRTEVTLRSVDFKDGQLLVSFSNPPKNDRHRHIVEEAKANYRPLYAAAAPFLMVKRAPKNARWVQGNDGGEDRNLPVDIPVDIALAGAPTID